MCGYDIRDMKRATFYFFSIGSGLQTKAVFWSFDAMENIKLSASIQLPLILQIQ